MSKTVVCLLQSALSRVPFYHVALSLCTAYKEVLKSVTFLTVGLLLYAMCSLRAVSLQIKLYEVPSLIMDINI
jgi:hypothetical protein